jgi:hypothetical protein
LVLVTLIPLRRVEGSVETLWKERERSEAEEGSR